MRRPGWAECLREPTGGGSPRLVSRARKRTGEPARTALAAADFAWLRYRQTLVSFSARSSVTDLKSQ